MLEGSHSLKISKLCMVICYSLAMYCLPSVVLRPGTKLKKTPGHCGLYYWRHFKEEKATQMFLQLFFYFNLKML
jgi:hypothetical protein